MLKYKLQPLYNQVAKDLNFPLDLVEDVIKHQFLFIKEQVINPSPSIVGIRLEDLGKFWFKHKHYVEGFRELKGEYRRGKIDPEFLQKYILMRHPVSAFGMLRKFKIRFGSWHWKDPKHDGDKLPAHDKDSSSRI